MTDDKEVCLRPGGLRPGGGGPNLFAAFSKGAGLGLRSKPVVAQALVPEVEHTPRKPPGQIVKYDREFLLKFMDRHIKAPMELQQLQLEIVISEDTERETQRQSLKQVVEDTEDDTRDWRTRAPPSAAAGAAAGPAAGAAGPAGPRQQGSAAPQQAAAQQQQQQQQRQPPSQESLRIHKAEEKGRVAYKVGGDLGQTERALRSVKGILNKLTPEKFERLLEQLLSVITSADILKHTISLVFENAVAQPTFCAMYADLCLSLSKELPSFPPAEGDDKPVMFRRVLLNTCQDEFEGAAAAREELALISSADERAAAEKRVKSRTLGTVRLIAELYRKEVVKEAIITVCLRELLEARDSSSSVPPEENVESACEMITVTGKMLAGSENKKARDTLDGYLARLSRLSSDKAMPSRLRFLIRDVLDMSKNKWVPRRETFTAKKLEQVHAEAEAELGMVSSKIGADLPALPVQARLAAEDFSLLPPLRGGGEGGWEFVGKRGAGGSKPSFAAGGSALVGEYKPPEPLAARAPPAAAAPAPAAAASRPAAAAAAPAAAAPKAASKPLAAEDVSNKTKSFLREYVSVGDGREARLCLQELRSAPKAGDVPDLRGVVEAAVAEVFDAQTDKASSSLLELLMSFLKEGLLSQEEAVQGLTGLTSALGDLALDVPKAPQLLGQLVGSAAAAGALPLSVLPQLLEGAEGCEAKRGFGEAALKAAAGGPGGQAGLGPACTAAGIKAGELFAADEFDGDLPSVEEWLKAAGLSSVPL